MGDVNERDIWRTVNSYWSGTGWTVEELEDRLPSKILLKLRDMHLKEDNMAMDRLEWNASHDGGFTVCSFYSKITSQGSMHASPNRDHIWKKNMENQGSSKVSAFSMAGISWSHNV